jgi:hypothetical protein
VESLVTPDADPLALMNRRFEMVEEKLNNVEMRIRRLEYHQNIAHNMDSEIMNRLRRELHQLRLQYLQTAIQSEEIVTKLYQENQELKSRILALTSENERLSSGTVSISVHYSLITNYRRFSLSLCCFLFFISI